MIEPIKLNEETILEMTNWSSFQKEYAGSLIYEIQDNPSKPLIHIIITRDYNKTSVRLVNIENNNFTSKEASLITNNYEIRSNSGINTEELFLDFLNEVKLLIGNNIGIFHIFGGMRSAR